MEGQFLILIIIVVAVIVCFNILVQRAKKRIKNNPKDAQVIMSTIQWATLFTISLVVGVMLAASL